MELITFLVAAGAVIGFLFLRKRIAELEEEVATARKIAATQSQVRELTQRVWELERHLPVLAPPSVAEQPSPETRVAKARDAEPIHPVREPARELPVVPPAIRPAFTPLPTPLPAVEPPTPSLADRLRRLLGDQEWESLVGGSVLNKLGALILVIGIALFLGYSFGHVTPAGRASIAILVSIAMLGAGVWVERLGNYKVFARGLIGAGWAALYATSYAVYAVPAARIIEDPLVGSLGTVAVAIGMIWHSLRYRAQAVTAIAYFAAFAAMAVTPSSPFAVVSLIPLAASLLYITARFDWHEMALFGLAATYLTCVSRGKSDASLVSTQSLFLAYWVLFEAFDLLRTKKRVLAGGQDLLFPLNTACFLGLSYLTWSTHSPDRLRMAGAFGATLFLADSIVRAVVRPPSTFEAGEDLTARLRAGSFEGAFVVSAVLAGLSIVGRVPGVWAGVGLALEAEIVYLAGLRFGSQFLRRLGAGAFVLSAMRTLWPDQIEAKTEVLGHSTFNWTPPALFHAMLFSVNRAIRKPNTIFSWSATIIVAAVLAAEVPHELVATAWILLGVALWEIGFRKQLLEFRTQAYALFASGLLLAAAAALPELWVSNPLALSISLAAIYGCALRSRWIKEVVLSGKERSYFALGMSAGTALLAALLVWKLAPAEYLGLAWSILAVVVLELGSYGLPLELRGCFGPLALIAAWAIVATHLDDFAKFPAPPVYFTYFGACLCAIAATIRLTLLPAENRWERTMLRDAIAAIACMAGLAGIWLVTPDAAVTILWTGVALVVVEIGVALEESSFRYLGLAALAPVYIRVFAFDLNHSAMAAVPFAIAGIYWIWHRFSRTPFWSRTIFWAALFPEVFLIGDEAGAHNAPLGWVLVATVLLAAGNRFQLRDARLQSYAVAVLSFGTAIWSDVDPARLWISTLTVAGLYASQVLAESSDEKGAPVFFSLLGTLLLSAILYGRVTGELLTVSWGLQGLCLLGIGFVFRARILRLQGLALLLICILKLFLYDLRNLETIYRILSFVALGVILLCVSWIYSRFRENLRRLL
jgi:uncharacterized membrane protein